MPAFLIPLIAAAASAIGGGLANRRSARTTTGNNSFNNTQTTTPTDLPEFANLRAMLAERAGASLSAPTPLAGYGATGIQNINRTSNTIQQALQNRLAASGLAGSPVAGAGAANIEQARGGEIARFQNSLPLLEREMRNEDLMNALRVYGAGPRSTTTTSSGTGTQQTVAPGSVAGGALSSAASMIAYLMGMGAFSRGSNAPGSV